MFTSVLDWGTNLTISRHGWFGIVEPNKHLDPKLYAGLAYFMQPGHKFYSIIECPNDKDVMEEEGGCLACLNHGWVTEFYREVTDVLPILGQNRKLAWAEYFEGMVEGETRKIMEIKHGVPNLMEYDHTGRGKYLWNPQVPWYYEGGIAIKTKIIPSPEGHPDGWLPCKPYFPPIWSDPKMLPAPKVEPGRKRPDGSAVMESGYTMEDEILQSVSPKELIGYEMSGQIEVFLPS
jgi:hypothetical protein